MELIATALIAAEIIGFGIAIEKLPDLYRAITRGSEDK